MARLILRRILLAIPLLWLVVTLTFVAVHAVPGTVADLIDNPQLSPQARAHIEQRFGLDRPVSVQYVRWLEALAHGDLGVSFLYRQPVSRVVLRALPPTLLLTGTALALDLILGILLAVIAVARPRSWFDRVSTVLSLGLYGMPSFWLAGLAILVFAVILGWLPASHMHSVSAIGASGGARFADLLRHLVLPAGVLGVVGAAGTARYLRSTLLDIQDARFLLAARARGLSRRRVLLVHALRPALLPLVTLLGLAIPFLVSGSLVIEVIFAWPGIGRVLWTAAWARDVPVILAVTLLGATAVIAGNLVADVLYILVDPRARSPR
ncbi:MAG: ABC transporter permease [Acidobacteria bacterium]|nr:ABC transporter permease [Acidobacteriota bacterium]